MSSILARLRKRTLSQQSSSSARQPPAAVPTSPVYGFSSSNPTLPSSRSEPSLVDRRIVEDLPALLVALDTESDPPGVLKPPRPRTRSGLASLPFLSSEDPEVGVRGRTSSEKENSAPSLARGPTRSSRWKSQTHSQRTTGTTNSPWSTFGKHRQRVLGSLYGGSSPSEHASRVGTSAMLGSSSSEGHPHSTLASASSVNVPSANTHHAPSAYKRVYAPSSRSVPSSVSHTSVARGQGSPHTFGEQSLSDEHPSKCASLTESLTASTDILPPAVSVHPQAPVVNPIGPEMSNPTSLSNKCGISVESEHERHVCLKETECSPSTSDDPQSFVQATIPPDPSELPAGVETLQPPLQVNQGYVSAGGPPRGRDGRLLPSAGAEPHAEHAFGEGSVSCSPSRFIPPSSPFPSSPTLLDAAALPITYRVLPHIPPNS
ncbi:hypothetical protein C8Q79DRAFT_198470 [Trametes meyenii]|nr:hypothetical protein C8Q79DRAFT_198470 [Trametes meyenii]